MHITYTEMESLQNGQKFAVSFLLWSLVNMDHLHIDIISPAHAMFHEILDENATSPKPVYHKMHHRIFFVYLNISSLVISCYEPWSGISAKSVELTSIRPIYLNI